MSLSLHCHQHRLSQSPKLIFMILVVNSEIQIFLLWIYFARPNLIPLSILSLWGRDGSSVMCDITQDTTIHNAALAEACCRWHSSRVRHGSSEQFVIVITIHYWLSDIWSFWERVSGCQYFWKGCAFGLFVRKRHD